MSQHVPARRNIGALVAVVIILTVTGCGAVDEDDLFKNMNGHDASTTPSQGAPRGDAPPNYRDNSRVTRAAVMDPRDEKNARVKAEEVEKALDASRRHGDVGPAAVRTTLGRLMAPSTLSVNRLRPARPGARSNEGGEGAEFFLGVGATACVSGSVTMSRVSVDVHGPYPDTGCGAPPFTH